MIKVVDRKKVPIYETVCWECGSKIRYTRKEVSLLSIICPVCGISNRVFPGEGGEVDYIEKDE